MAIIPQKSFFDWGELEDLGDLERLRLVIEYMPDEDLMRDLEKERGHGRNDYPVRAMWNAVLAGVVFQHNSEASLRRELRRNGQLRQLCGFKPNKIPPAWAFSRFLKKLLKKEEKIEEIFNKLVKELEKLLPGFGKNLAIDGKAIESHANPGKKDKEKGEDGRRDLDADFGKKVYRGKNKDGTLWEKIKSWFGYKLHLIVDADYELPVAFEVTKASAPEEPQAHALITKLNKDNPEILESCEYLMGDKGLDDGKLITRLWKGFEIKPVIDIRLMWKDGEETRLVTGKSNIVYDNSGTVYCHCPITNKRREMAYGGFEADREALKYRCPAWHYGIECKGWDTCPVKKSTRISLEEDRRIFTPLARSSVKWDQKYKKRTAVERVNGRLDLSFGFENHFIRGIKKMRLKLGLSFCVMLAMALGHIKEKQPGKIRSLVA